MKRETLKTVLMSFASTMLVLAFVVSGYLIVNAHAEEYEIETQLDPFNVSSPENEESEQAETTEQAAIPYGDYEYETLLTLKSIEYQLKIIAGGVILAVCSAFIWYTILKPIKMFTRV